MSDAYVIEIHGKTVGLIVRYPGQEPGYRFLASDHAFNPLEGTIFSGALHAERAARDFAKRGNASRTPAPSARLNPARKGFKL